MKENGFTFTIFLYIDKYVRREGLLILMTCLYYS